MLSRPGTVCLCLTARRRVGVSRCGGEAQVPARLPATPSCSPLHLQTGMAPHPNGTRQPLPKPQRTVLVRESAACSRQWTGRRVQECGWADQRQPGTWEALPTPVHPQADTLPSHPLPGTHFTHHRCSCPLVLEIVSEVGGWVGMWKCGWGGATRGPSSLVHVPISCPRPPHTPTCAVPRSEVTTLHHRKASRGTQTS